MLEKADVSKNGRVMEFEKQESPSWVIVVDCPGLDSWVQQVQNLIQNVAVRVQCDSRSQPRVHFTFQHSEVTG